MKIATIMLDEKEWDQFHSNGSPDDVFFAILEPLRRAGDGMHIDPANVPLIALQAIVFHQAWHAIDGSYSWKNAFHGFTADHASKPGFLRNVRAMSTFMTALGAPQVVDVLSDIIDIAEVLPAGVWGETDRGILDLKNATTKTKALSTNIFQAERLHTLLTLEILEQAAVYVQQHCPVSRIGAA